jgi:glycosyltransferase involved in cell wall biosynthesis
MRSSLVPKVSVLIPTYNRQQYLVEVIRSVQVQTQGEWEIIVVDDGSTDDTQSVIEAFRETVRYFYQQNQGVSVARNLAFRESIGEYVVFLDSDDFLLPNALADLSGVLDSNPECDVGYSDGYVVDDNGARWATLSDYSARPFVDSLETFVANNPLGVGSAIFRRAALEGIDGPFDSQMVGYEDWDMMVRLKASGCNFCFIPSFSYCYRIHGRNKSAPKSSLAERRRLSLVRSRQKVMDASWFESLSMPTKYAFFDNLLTIILQGDRMRQEQTISHPSFLSLPAKICSGILYRMTVNNVLSGGVKAEDRQRLVTCIRLDPVNLKAHSLFILSLAGHELLEKTLSRWRTMHTSSQPTDPVTQILQSKKAV